MAVYNGAAYLRQAADSILNQTFRDFEFLIIDDGSTDDSPTILSSYNDSRIRILKNPENIGLTRSLNRGLAEARGELIARQDADDVSHPTRIEKQVNYMTRNSDVVLLGTQAFYINAKKRHRRSALWWKASTASGIRFQSIFGNPFLHTSAMFRKSVVWEIFGGYDEEFRTSQDFELWSRIIETHEIRNLSEVLVSQRAHARSLSANYVSQDWRRLETVFRRNLKTALGGSFPTEHWPTLWMEATSPQALCSTDLFAVLATARSIFTSFYTRGLTEMERREVKYCFAISLLLMGRYFALRSQTTAMKAVLHALRLSPLAVLPELLRVVGSIILAPRMRCLRQNTR